MYVYSKEEEEGTTSYVPFNVPSPPVTISSKQTDHAIILHDRDGQYSRSATNCLELELIASCRTSGTGGFWSKSSEIWKNHTNLMAGNSSNSAPFFYPHAKHA